MMRVRALYDLARFLPLMSWSGNASLLGVASAVIASGGLQSIPWNLTIMAIFVSVALQYVAHPINDLVDHPVDVLANIDGTGRRKVLISGLATERDLRLLSQGLLLIIAGVAAYIIWFRPLGILFGAIGFLSVWAYNAPPLQLSYRPFPELLVAFPVNIAMVTGISYVAIGTVTPLALTLGVIQAFMASAVLISYFAMDMQSDVLGGKFSTIVSFPGIRWCTIYPLIGTVILGLDVGLNQELPGLLFPVFLLGWMAFLGFRIDNIWMDYRGKYGQSLRIYLRERAGNAGHAAPQLSSLTIDAWHRASGAMRNVLVHQMYISILNGAGLFIFVLVGMQI